MLILALDFVDGADTGRFKAFLLLAMGDLISLFVLTVSSLVLITTALMTGGVTLIRPTLAFI
jgi:hypothetical protein